MDQAQTAPRFDWIAWLATIPGVPSDWGVSPSRLAQQEPPAPDDGGDDFAMPMLKAA
jgi:hypothetical protein